MATFTLRYMITTLVMVQMISGAPLTDTKTDIAENQTIVDDGKKITHSSLLVDGLFEGDLELSEDFIRKFYDFGSVTEYGDIHNNTEDETETGLEK